MQASNVVAGDSIEAVVGMRELGPRDEDVLRALVRKVYGDTYSYRHVYEQGGIASLIESGRVSLWGDFTQDGELASHTGFFYKDPRGDYVESGMSLRHPALRPVTTDAEVWRRFFAWLGRRFAYVHQNTTTYHPLAQRYAERYMRAVPAGFIVDYAVGERLMAIATSDAPMHALMMTTAVEGHPQPDVRLPRGRWSPWLAMVATGLGLAPVEVDAAPYPLGTTLIEHNQALDLVRRSVARDPMTRDPVVAAAVARDPAAFTPTGSRIDLVHVPLDERMGAIPALEAAGYVPVGLRAHATRPHEVVMQHAKRDHAAAAVATMRLAPSGAAIIKGWQACQHGA